MPKLYERLPDRVKCGRRTYRLRLGFRDVMRMMDTLGRQDLLPDARDFLALRCVVRGRLPRDTEALLSAVTQLLFGEDAETGGERVTSFEQDADLIRAAFWQEYGVNLYRDDLHWFEFQALLRNLPSGSRYMDVLGIRTEEIPAATKYNAKEREALLRAKAHYALKVTAEETKQNYQDCVHRVFASLRGIAKEG